MLQKVYVLLCLPLTVTAILGGIPTLPHEFPWMAHVETKAEGGKGVHKCGGVIIWDNIVMTAAHCVDQLPIKVKVGHHDITSDQIVTIQVDTMLMHPGYTTVINGNDIALLRLSKRLSFNSNVFLKFGETCRCSAITSRDC